MSWDVNLIKTETNHEPFEKIEEGTSLSFDRQSVICTLAKRLQEICVVSDDWLVYDNKTTCAIEFDLMNVKSIMLHVHVLNDADEDVLDLLHNLCESLECRAFDTALGEFLFQNEKAH